jgi:hypothetical protein
VAICGVTIHVMFVIPFSLNSCLCVLMDVPIQIHLLFSQLKVV